MSFGLYNGDLIGLPTSGDHLIFKWNEPGCKILFSAAKQGNGMSCHFASDKRGLRKIKSAISAFVEFIFKKYPWCEMIFAKVTLPSVGRILPKLGFSKLIKTEYCNVYILER